MGTIAPTEGRARPALYARARAIGFAVAAAALCAGLSACRVGRSSFLHTHRRTSPFNFVVATGPNNYQIAGYLTLSADSGRLPALLVLNGQDTAEQCVDFTKRVVAIGIQVACISIPGYGRSSGPSRYVGPQAVAAAQRALDILVARPDVDPDRLAVWGLGTGAVAAGLLMDYDSRPRALVLESGAYDMLSLWKKTTMRTRLSILHQVWPSKRVLAERSVIRHLPARLACSVLILHGEKDKTAPIGQAEKLAEALRDRGARVETRYFRAGHRLGNDVSQALIVFLRENLIEANHAAAS